MEDKTKALTQEKVLLHSFSWGELLILTYTDLQTFSQTLNVNRN